MVINMKIIDAVWEKKNLGVQTIEIVVEKDDVPEIILPRIAQIDAEYTVVKIPSDYVPVTHNLFRLGFIFMETMNCISNNLSLRPLTKQKAEIVANTDFTKMTDQDFEMMCARILKEKIYRTDRIARDPYFNLEQANQRYVNWLRSERSRGAEIYKYVYQGDNIGYLCFKHIGDGVYEDFLSGIYSEFAGKGLAVSIPYKVDEYVKKCGGRRIITHISSTNVRSLSSRINNGYVIDSSNYVFSKHSY